MQLANFLKNVRRQARIESRIARIGTLVERATAANNSDQVEAFGKESKRRAAEANYLATRNEADLEDHPEWGDAHDAMRSAVLSGSRGSSEAKGIMAAALGAGAATAQVATE